MISMNIGMALTPRARTKVIAAVFLTFVSVGLASDLLDGLRRPAKFTSWSWEAVVSAQCTRPRRGPRRPRR
jgi:hypothetical protein